MRFLDQPEKRRDAKMKIFKKISLLFCSILTLLLAGCYGIPIDWDAKGMTKAEVAEYLARHACRSRWSGNRFDIEIQERVINTYSFRNAQEVMENQAVMSADQWRCDFFPQRHWLLGWNGLFARWLYYTIEFKDGKAVRQVRPDGLPYFVKGRAGQSPFPQIPQNFHRVSKDIYRSNQPDDDQFESLYTFNGIRSVLNLRENNSDKDAINAVNKKYKKALTLYEIPLNTGKITEQDLYKILTVIRDAPKPLLIHCWHGSDRTGCAVAAYRIVFENWSVEDAVAELMKPEYGHHKNIYTNIPELLRKADWKKIKETIL